MKWLGYVGFEAWRPRLPCARETSAGGYPAGDACDPWTRLHLELQLLISNESFFEETQRGRRRLIEYGSSWQVSSPAFLNKVVPLLPELRKAYEARGCTLVTMTMLRHPVGYLIGQYFADETDEARRYEGSWEPWR